MAAAIASVKKQPAYYDLIKEAVTSLHDKSGSSRHAIDKYVSAKKGASYSKTRLNLAIKKGVLNGKLLPVKGCFKLPKAGKPSSPKSKSKNSVIKIAINKKNRTSTKKSLTKASGIKKLKEKKAKVSPKKSNSSAVKIDKKKSVQKVKKSVSKKKSA